MSSWRGLIMCWTWLLPLSVAWAASVEDQTRAVMEDFYEQVEAASRAQAQGHADMVQKHQRNAEQFIGKARAILDEADAGESEDLAVLLLYGEVLGLQREYDLAAEVLRRATVLAPQNAGLWRSLGRALAEAGEAFAAEAHGALRRALELEPAPDVATDAHQTQGRVYQDQGLYDLAQKSYEAALALDPQAPGALIGMAALELQRGDVLGASERIQSLGAAAAEHGPMMQTMLVEAFKTFEKNRAWFADTAENHKAYGMLLLRSNRLAYAVEPLERALVLEPQDYISWNMLSSVYRGLGNAQRAKEALQKSLEVNPDQPRTQQLLKALIAAEEAPAPPASIAAPPGQ